MNCPNCGSTNNKIVERDKTTDSSERLRRGCVDCYQLFTTYEVSARYLSKLQNLTQQSASAALAIGHPHKNGL